MKKLLFPTFLLITLLITTGCPPTPSQVCFKLPDGNQPCVSTQATMHWLTNRNGTIMLDTLPNLPTDFAQYPQFGNQLVLANDVYDVIIQNGLMVITRGGQPTARSSAEMGFFVLRNGGVTTIVSATTDNCDQLALIPSPNGWTVADSLFPTAIDIFTKEVEVEADGSKIITRTIEPNSAVSRSKGTTVVLIDNFNPVTSRGGSPCCTDDAFACCTEREVAVDALGTLTFNLPSGASPSSTLHHTWWSDFACFTLSCANLRVANCLSREVNCYNTGVCKITLWIDAQHGSIGITTNGCTSMAGFTETCASTTDPIE